MGLARPRAPPASTKASGALGPCPGSLAGLPTSCCDYSAVSRVELLEAALSMGAGAVVAEDKVGLKDRAGAFSSLA